MRSEKPIVKSIIAAIALLGLTVIPQAACIFDEDGHFMFMADYDHKQEIQKTFPLAAGGTFSLKNTNGKIRIATWSRPEVEIKAEKAAARESDLDRVEIKFDAGEGYVRVDTVYERYRNLRVRVNYQISVPEGTRLEPVSNTNGDIELTGMYADAKIGTTNGDIKLDRSRGSLTLDTTNGSIRVSGHVGSISADTTNGGINLEVESFESDIKADTTNGSIHLRVGGAINANLRAHTTNGRITTDLPVTLQGVISSRRRLEGTIGSGGPQIELETTNGSITIEKR